GPLIPKDSQKESKEEKIPPPPGGGEAVALNQGDSSPTQSVADIPLPPGGGGFVPLTEGEEKPAYSVVGEQEGGKVVEWNIPDDPSKPVEKQLSPEDLSKSGIPPPPDGGDVVEIIQPPSMEKKPEGVPDEGQELKPGQWKGADGLIYSPGKLQTKEEFQEQWKKNLQESATERQKRIDQSIKVDLNKRMFPRVDALTMEMFLKPASVFARGLSGIPIAGEGLGDLADQMTQFSNGYERAAAEYDKKGWLPESIPRVTRGLATTLPGAVLSGAAAGPYGMIAYGATDAMNQAAVAGADKGLTGNALRSYVMTEGAANAVPYIIAQRFGMGGLINRFSGKGPEITNGLMGALKQYGIETVEQLHPAVASAIGHNITSAIYGVESDAAKPGELFKAAMEATVNTLAMGAAGFGIHALTSKLPGQKVPLRMPDDMDKVNKIMEASGSERVPSRKEWREMGLPSEYGRSRSQRRENLKVLSEEYYDHLAKGVPEQYHVPQTYVDSIRNESLILKQPEWKQENLIELYPAQGDTPAIQGEFLGRVNGKKVYAVEIDKINQRFEPYDINKNFNEAGNHSRYDYIPENEYWVSRSVEKSELPHWMAREAIEDSLMSAHPGLLYDKPTTGHPIPARDIANTTEWGWIENSPNGDVRLQTSQPEIVPPKGVEPEGVAKLMQEESGAMVPEKILAKIKEKADEVRNSWHKTDAAVDIVREKDSADNKASLRAIEMKNEIGHAYARSEGQKKLVPTKWGEMAMPYMGESLVKGGRSYLLREQAKLESIKDPTKVQRDQKVAIQYALDNETALRPAAMKAKEVWDEDWGLLASSGIDVKARQDFAWPRDWKQQPTEYPTIFPEHSTGAKKTALHERQFETYADAIVAGMEPKGSPLEIAETRLRNNRSLENNQAWVESGKYTIDPLSKLPVLAELTKNEKGEMKPPKGYSVGFVGNKPFGILDGYVPVYRAVTGSSYITEGQLGKGVMWTVGLNKQVATLLDSFHLGKVSFFGSFIDPRSVIGFKRGKTALENSRSELIEMARRGEISKAMLPEMLEDNRITKIGVSEGFNAARVYDNYGKEIVKDFFHLGGFNSFIFENYQRGVMSKAFCIEFKRTKAMLPELTEQQVARRVAKDINTRFGQFGRQGFFKSQTGRDISRILFFAPQWLEGLVKSEIRSITGLKETASYALHGRLVYNSLVKQAATGLVSMFVGAQILNYLLNGKPTWENEEEGIGAKMSAKIPGIGKGQPGFLWNPLGQVAPCAHRMMNYMEKKGNVLEAAEQFMKAKMGFVPRTVYNAAVEGHKDHSALSASKVALESMIPLPIAAQAVGSAFRSTEAGQIREEYPGQIGKQIFSSAGIDVDVARTPEQRMRNLANEFREKQVGRHGVVAPPKGEYTPDPSLSELT
ncbi:MAG: hypothetical protein WC919_06060, partial [Candidatus Paceibacterota bacterium]